jgi:hypothetical protein
MSTRRILVVLFLASTLAAVACRKVEPRFSTTVATPLPPPKTLASIALEYGELVAAAPSPDNPYWFVLWFQKPDKTITVVYVNASRGLVVPQATIPRR